MDFSNHPLNINQQSMVDKLKLKQSTIDYQTDRLRKQLNDPELGSRMVALSLSKLGEAKINELVDYVTRKSDHPGKAFVGLCHKLIKEKS